LLEIVTRLTQVLLENEEMRKLRIEVFCNMTTCTLVDKCKHFEETRWFHLQSSSLGGMPTRTVVIYLQNGADSFPWHLVFQNVLRKVKYNFF